MEAIHAGLECGILAGKLPGLDCVSIGPDLTEIHTPRERMHIASVQRVWRFVTELVRPVRVMEIEKQAGNGLTVSRLLRFRRFSTGALPVSGGRFIWRRHFSQPKADPKPADAVTEQTDAHDAHSGQKCRNGKEQQQQAQCRRSTACKGCCGPGGGH